MLTGEILVDDVSIEKSVWRYDHGCDGLIKLFNITNVIQMPKQSNGPQY